MRTFSALWSLLPAVLWLVLCVSGGVVVMGYDFQAGTTGARQTSWPPGTTLRVSEGEITILAFLHPRCGCTAATVENLIGVVSQHQNVRLTAVIFTPPGSGADAEWTDSEYACRIRAALPSAHVVLDPRGVEAHRFGALTSGTIIVYDAARRELFRGGITNRRGGDGDNPGLRQLQEILATGRANRDLLATTPVFGCPLHDAETLTQLAELVGEGR